MLFLLKNWKHIAVIILTLTVAYAAHGMRVSWIKSSHAVEMEETRLDAQAACMEAQTHSNEVSNEYQGKIKDINTRHADAISRLLKHEASMCAARASSGFNAATGKELSTEARAGIISSLAKCGKQAEQLEGLQTWLNTSLR